MKPVTNMMLCLLVVAESILFINSIEVVRESRSIESAGGISKLLSTETQTNEKLLKNKSIQRLVGGHVKNIPQDSREVLDEESTGNGKSNKLRKDADDEDKKTLAQQVAEGKYGLIQKELFTDPPRRPGILSYKDNEDVPKDTKSTLGGLDADDIWLAEDHLLVLKGGSFPEHNSKADTGANWPPIDNYRAPRRQVKIPSNPKIPPPFPIQLEDSGPIEFIGPNGTTYPIHEGPETAGYPIEGYVPGSGPFFPTPSNDFNYTGDTPFPVPPYGGVAAPGNFSTGNGRLPPFPYGHPDVDPAKLPPYIASLPPGTAFLPALENKTDFYDEDDPSIYYPPPYSFYYPSDNSSSVPPGPLVPGIVLPPPPDFFAPLDEKKKEEHVPKYNVTRTTTTVPQTPPTTSVPVIKIKPVPNAIPPTKHTPSKTVYITPPKPIYKPPPTMQPITKPIYVPDVQKHVQIGYSPGTDNYDNSLQSITTPKPIVHTPTPPKIKYTTPYVPKVSTYYTSRRPDVSLSYLQQISKNPNLHQRPTVPTTTPAYYDYSENYYENNAVSQTPRPFPVYGPPERQRIPYKVPGRAYITTTAVPLKAYFTTGRDIESNSVTANPVNYYQHTDPPTRQPSKINPASYYYYEEDSIENSLSSTTQTPQGNRYYNTDQNGRQQYHNNHNVNYYDNTRNAEGITEFIPTQRQQYQLYQRNTQPESITSKIARLRQEIQSYLAPNKVQVQYQTTPKSIYEYSFQAAGYVPKNTNNPQTSSEDPFRPIVQYSVPYDQSKSIAHNGHLRTEQTSTEGYYPSKNRYEEAIPVKIQPNVPPQRQNFQQQHQYNYVRATPNPIDHAYYTKQDERLLDDITKQYFTVFGKKINDKGLSVTPSLRDVEVTTVKTPVNKYVDNKETYYSRRPENPNIEIKYGDNSQTIPDKHIKEISLLSDIDVNYKHPRPEINPDSEFIPIVNPAYTHAAQINNGKSLESDILVNYKYPKPNIHPDAEYINPSYTRQPEKVNISLHSDINVNYKYPLPQINPDAEIVEHIHPHGRKPNAEALEPGYDPREPNTDNIETFYNDYKQNGNAELGYNRKPEAEYVEVFYPTEYHQNNNREQLNQHLNQQHNVINYQNGQTGQTTAQVVRNNYIPKYPSNNNVEIVKSINVLAKQINPVEQVSTNFRQYEPVDNVRGQINQKHVGTLKENNNAGEGRPGSFISYQLPGDGAHFYFLTPQAALRNSGRNDGYVYEERQRQRRSRLRQRAQRQHSQRAQQTEN